MNKVYKVIYNKKRQLTQVVSEISGGFTRSERTGRRSELRCLVLSCLVMTSVWILPLGVQAATLEERVAANTTKITQNASNIAANKTAINQNKANISANKTAINQNKTDIAANKTAINQNKANIAANKTAIDQNKTYIAANKTSINTNKTNIAANKSAIGQNKTDIAANKSAIEQNKNNIEANKTAIDTNKSNITTNKNNIEDLANSLGLTVDNDGNITGKSSLTKYFKAKSSTSSYTETITNPDGTTTTKTTTLKDKEASANGDNSVAVGPNASSNGKQSVALGDGAVTKGTANRGIAIGTGAITGVTADMPADQGSDVSTSSGGIDSISIGTDANSRGNDAISIGHKAVVQNIPVDGSGTMVSKGSIAIGSDAKVYGSNNSLAFGTGASVAADNQNGNTANEAIAIGYKAAVKENATQAIAIGSEAVADKAKAIAIGHGATSQKNSLALGNEAEAKEQGLAIGNGAQSKSANAQAFGNGAVATSEGDISIGNQAGVGSDSKRANVDGAIISIGVKAGQNVIGTANVAVGNNAGSNVHSNYNVAVGSEAGQGFQTEASTDNPQNGYNVSIGYKANDFSDNSASSSIQYATAIGAQAKAYSNGTAIGRAALANGDYTLALGENAHAYDGSSIAFGANSTARHGNIAIGSGSDAASEVSGTGYLTNQAAPTSYISVGKSDNLRRISNVADGSADSDAATVGQLKLVESKIQSGSGTTGGVTQSYVDTKISALTSSIESLKQKYFSVSSNAETNQNNKDNNGASADNKNAMAIGPGVAAEADDAVAVGNNTKAVGAGSIAIGSEGPVDSGDSGDSNHNTAANGERSVAIGSGSVAQTDHSIAIGTRATNYNQVNQDNEASNQGNKSIAIGYYAETSGDSAVAAGDQAVAAGNGSVAIGKSAGTLAGAKDSIAAGTETQVKGATSTVVGSHNNIVGDRSHAFGTGNTMKNTGSGKVDPIYESGMVGNDNTISAINNNQDDHVGSVTDAHMIGNKNIVSQENEGFTIKDVQISGSSNKVQGADSTAAEAGSLTGVTIDGFGNTVKGRNLDSTLNKTENINIVGNNNTVDVNNAGNKSNLSNVQILGSNVNATVGNSAYIGSKSSAKKTADSTTAGAAAYAGETYKNRSGEAVTFAGSKASGVVTVGSAGNERRIQNVAAGRVGAGSTDAINGSQLYYATRDHHYLGDNSDLAQNRNVVDVGADGHMNVVGETKDLNGNRITTTEGLKKQLTDGNIGVVANSDNQTMVVKLNKDVVLGSDTQDGSLTLKNNNGQQTAKLTATTASSNLDGSATINRAALSGRANTSSRMRRGAANSSESTYAVATMSDGLSFVGDDGTAVNRVLNTQLSLQGGATGTLTNNNIGVNSFSTDDGTTGFKVQLASDLTGLNSVSSTSVTTNNLTVNGGDFKVENGTNVNMGGNQIHNVAPGTESTDAVNVSQLHGLTMDVQNEFERVDGRIDNLDNRISHAGANAAALAALHPNDFDPDDKWDFAGGYGNYRGANAMALGAFYRPTEDVMFSVGASIGGGENMVNAGVTFKLGQKNHVSNSRVAMAKEIRDMRKALAEQSAEIAELKAAHGMKIDPMKSDLFPDVAENHWAYEYVSKLAGNGVLKGYPDGLFHGDRMMSRYEFAAIVYRIVQSGAGSTDPELSRLVKDFSPELRYIRIDTIQKDKDGNPTIERVRVNKLNKANA
jgi:hypothetical protein